MKELLLAFLTKTLNLTSEEAAKLLYKLGEDGKLTEEFNTDALGKILELDAARVSQIKESGKVDTQELFNNGFKKAQKEVLAAHEKAIREEFGVDNTDLTGIDLVREVISKNTKSKGGELTDENVKKHPLYLGLEKTKTSALDELKGEYEGKISSIESQYKRNAVLGTVKNDARSILAGLNPVISENQTVAQNRELDFLTKLESYEFQPGQNGEHLVLDKETGNRLEDQHGHPVRFTDVVKEKAALYYDFKKQGEKGNGGNEGGQGGKSGGVQVPKTKDERDTAIIAAKTKEERTEIQKAWEESQS